MYLAQIRAENFRLFERLSLLPHSRLNLVMGANAAGKTSVLEAIYCLARAKSFRSSSPAELARSPERYWKLAADVQREQTPPLSLYAHWDTRGSEIQMDRKPATTLELVRACPVQVMEPGMHRLLQEGPAYRRSFLDWGVFHVEPSFIGWWRRFQRALKQRNHALRVGAPKAEAQAWNRELAETAVALNTLREQHATALQSRLGYYVQRLLGMSEWRLELYRGWASGEYLEILDASIERDRRQGMTVEGPHRAELRIRLQDHQVKNRISRGQQKLLIFGLILAQAELIHQTTGQAPILLADDFSAELATGFQQTLLDVLVEYPGQIFVTAFEREGPLARPLDASVFHVEHGGVSPV